MPRVGVGLRRRRASALGGEAFTTPLDGLAGLTAAYSLSRSMLSSFVGSTRYTTISGAIDSWKNQTGVTARDLNQSVAGERPTLLSNAVNGRLGASFDGTDDTLQSSGALSTFIANNAGYVICSVYIDDSSTNSVTVYENDGLWTDSGNNIGVFVRDNAGAHTIGGYNWDGTADAPTAQAVTVPGVCVIELKREGGNVLHRLNGVSWQSAASGNTASMVGTFVLGGEISGISKNYLDCKVIELATFNTVPSAAQQDALVQDMLAWVGADNLAPAITSANTANVAENVTLSHTLTANEPVTWSIVGGADAALFEISGNTLRWLANTTRDYENPVDTGANNTYVVTVRATDLSTNAADQTITVTVTDVADGGGGDPPEGPSADFSVATNSMYIALLQDPF